MNDDSKDFVLRVPAPGDRRSEPPKPNPRRPAGLTERPKPGTVVLLTATKVCERCGQEKPNDRDHFPLKQYRFRDVFTTTDVCKGCKSAAISAKAAERRARYEAAQDEDLAKLRTIFGGRQP